MENIKIRSGKYTPSIITIKESGLLQIKGASTTEDSENFYKNVRNWVINYFEEETSLTLVMKIYYMNSASTKIITEIVRLCDSIGTARVLWFYESDDEDIEQMGTVMRDITKVKDFWIIPKETMF